MSDPYDFNQVNEFVEEYLRFYGLEKTAEILRSEENKIHPAGRYNKQKQINQVPKSQNDLDRFPFLYKFLPKVHNKAKNEIKVESDLKELNRQHMSVLQSSRQIFSIAINCLQQLHNIKDGNSMTENLGETIDNYKIQLGKYHQILQTEGKSDRSELFSEAVMMEHKQKLIKAKEDQNIKTTIEVLLSLRVNALQISPELRKNLVYELIRNDIFLLNTKMHNGFLLDLLNTTHIGLRHAMLSLISVIVSTLKGTEYLMTVDFTVMKKIIEILKKEEDGGVNQRFCIAILQKMSIKEDTIPLLVEENMIQWIIDLVIKSKQKEIHSFSLDFSSALLANILHANYTNEYLSKNTKFVLHLMKTILGLLADKIPTSVLMHLLICLSYLSKDKFSKQSEEINFADRISEFVEYYSQVPTQDSENGEIDKRTVLDLCAHMFHPKDISNDLSQTMEYNDMKQDDKIREFENEQGDLIFECFQDEEKMFQAN